MEKKVDHNDDESQLLDTQGCTTNTELLGSEYYAMMEICPSTEPVRGSCDKHSQETAETGEEKQVLVTTSTFAKIEPDVEHGLVPFKMRGRGSRWLTNMQCIMVLLCFFIVFVVCVAPIFFTLKHAVSGDSEKHEQFSIVN